MAILNLSLATNIRPPRSLVHPGRQTGDHCRNSRRGAAMAFKEVYPKAYQNVPEARAGIGAYMGFYNEERPHQA